MSDADEMILAGSRPQHSNPIDALHSRTTFVFVVDSLIVTFFLLPNIWRTRIDSSVFLFGSLGRISKQGGLGLLVRTHNHRRTYSCILFPSFLCYFRAFRFNSVVLYLQQSLVTQYFLRFDSLEFTSILYTKWDTVVTQFTMKVTSCLQTKC